MIYVQTEEGKVDIFSTLIGVEPHKKDDVLKKPISKKNYIICFTERAGSTMLCSLLKKTGFLGIPEEYVNPRGVMQHYLKQYPALDTLQYFDLLRRNQVSPNCVFGMKTSFPDFEPLLAEGIVAKLLSPIKFIYLTRQDIILQAISSYVARHSGLWHAFKNQSESQSVSQAIKYEETKILKLVDKLILERLQWERFFTLYSIEPLRITYEGILEDTNKTVQSILAFMDEKINTQIDLKMSETSKIGGERNKAWAKRIRAKYVL